MPDVALGTTEDDDVFGADDTDAGLELATEEVVMTDVDIVALAMADEAELVEGTVARVVEFAIVAMEVALAFAVVPVAVVVAVVFAALV